MDATTDDFRPSTLYEALSGGLSGSFPQQPYKTKLGDSIKGISSFEYESGRSNETKLHCIVPLSNLFEELDKYVHECTYKLIIDESDKNYSDFLRVVNHQKTLNLKNEAPRTYTENDICSIVKSNLLDPAIYALRVLERMDYKKDGKANLSSAFGLPADYSFWFGSFPKLSNKAAIADGALYKRTREKQKSLPEDKHSNSYLSTLLKKYRAKKQKGEYIPLSGGDEEAICCTLEIKSQSFIDDIGLEDFPNMFIKEEENNVAMPFLYPAPKETPGPTAQCRLFVQIYNQMLYSNINFSILSTYNTTFFVHRRTINKWNTLFISEGIYPSNLSPAHVLAWYLQSMRPSIPSLCNDPNMGCVDSWFGYEKGIDDIRHTIESGPMRKEYISYTRRDPTEREHDWDSFYSECRQKLSLDTTQLYSEDSSFIPSSSPEIQARERSMSELSGSLSDMSLDGIDPSSILQRLDEGTYYTRSQAKQSAQDMNIDQS